MKVIQPKLAVGTEGKVLIDATNVKSSALTNFKDYNPKKRKSENIENFKHAKIIRKDGIYSDPETLPKKKSFVDQGVQTHVTHYDESKEKAQRVKDMLTSDSAPSEYWESLAEKRRVALSVTLEENRELREENDHLKEENKTLEEMLGEAKELAALVQEITNGTEDDEKDENQANVIEDCLLSTEVSTETSNTADLTVPTGDINEVSTETSNNENEDGRVPAGTLNINDDCPLSTTQVLTSPDPLHNEETTVTFNFNGNEPFASSTENESDEEL